MADYHWAYYNNDIKLMAWSDVMTILSVRGLDEEVLKALKTRSLDEESSVNAVVVKLLREGVGVAPGKRKTVVHHDLDELAGTWSEADAAAFAQATQAFAEIDPALWKAPQ